MSGSRNCTISRRHVERATIRHLIATLQEHERYYHWRMYLSAYLQDMAHPLDTGIGQSVSSTVAASGSPPSWCRSDYGLAFLRSRCAGGYSEPFVTHNSRSLLNHNRTHGGRVPARSRVEHFSCPSIRVTGRCSADCHFMFLSGWMGHSGREREYSTSFILPPGHAFALPLDNDSDSPCDGREEEELWRPRCGDRTSDLTKFTVTLVWHWLTRTAGTPLMRPMLLIQLRAQDLKVPVMTVEERRITAVTVPVPYAFVAWLQIRDHVPL